VKRRKPAKRNNGGKGTGLRGKSSVGSVYLVIKILSIKIFMFVKCDFIIY
jgi:hypothetical protein